MKKFAFTLVAVVGLAFVSMSQTGHDRPIKRIWHKGIKHQVQHTKVVDPHKTKVHRKDYQVKQVPARQINKIK